MGKVAHLELKDSWHSIECDERIEINQSLEKVLFLLLVGDVVPRVFPDVDRNVSHKFAKQLLQLTQIFIFEGLVRLLVGQQLKNVLVEKILLGVLLLARSVDLLRILGVFVHVCCHLVNSLVVNTLGGLLVSRVVLDPISQHRLQLSLCFRGTKRLC